MPPGTRRNAWTLGSLWRHLDLERDLINVTDREEYIEAVRHLLESNRFDWLFYPVASLGFLASSYSLFATSIIWPALAYVYRHDEPSNTPANVNPGVTFDLVTLAGIILGMIGFGHLADRVGRSRLYGLELMIITIATIGITFSSDGYMVPVLTASSSPPLSLESDASNAYNYLSTMNIFTAITCWRFLLGVGIGAEYPMSAIIAAECSSREWRGTTMAAVFLMQSIGRLMAFGFGNAFLEDYLTAKNVDRYDTSYRMNLAIDAVWRFVAGLGGVFALIAVALRLTMPESPKYIGCDQDLRDAMLTEAKRNALAAAEARIAANPGRKQVPTPWFLGAIRYLAHNNNWKRLATISVIWFLLDVCFYGTGLDSPTTLNLLWLSSPLTSQPQYDYEEDPANVTQSIFWVLDTNGGRTLEVSSITSIIGSLVVIVAINYVPRRYLLFWTSLGLSAIFVIAGALVLGEFASPRSKASLVFYALAQFAFNLGPNTVVFVLAAEIFPTMFRGTFYGIAAASGKAGAMLIRPFVQMAASGVIDDRSPARLGGMIFAFGAVMLGIAFLTWSQEALLVVQDGEESRKWFEPLADKDLDDIAPIPEAGELVEERATVNGQNISLQDLTAHT